MSSTDTEVQSAAGETAMPWPAPRQSWYALGIFTAALMFNFLDRGILTLLVEPIKRDLQLSDTQMSLIMGFAFVAFYAVVGLPIARLVDIYSRRVILGVGIALWSGMTAMCGLAQTFWQLFAARLFVGVGEACNGPATFSMLSDLFPREKLPKAISVLNIGFVFGQGIALIVGGTVIGMIARLPEIQVPLLGAVKPWQVTFLAVGLPGLIVAALMMTVREPARRGLIAVPGAGSPQRPGTLPVREIVRFMFENRRAYAPLYLGLAVHAVMLVGIISWLPAFFVRVHGWDIAQFGQVLGLIMLVISPLGLMLGGYLAEWFARKGYDDANMRVVVIAATLSLPPLILFPLVADPWVAIVLLAFQNFILAIAPGPQNAALQIITPNQIRGQVTALFLFVFNIIGFGFGPTFIALITDYVLHSEARLGEAMALAAAVMGPLAAFIFWRGLRHYGAAVARAREWK
jgi:MFS family permease